MYPCSPHSQLARFSFNLLDSARNPITLVPIRQSYAYAQTVLSLSIASDLIRQPYVISDAAHPLDLSRIGTPLHDYSGTPNAIHVAPCASVTAASIGNVSQEKMGGG